MLLGNARGGGACPAAATTDDGTGILCMTSWYASSLHVDARRAFSSRRDAIRDGDDSISALKVRALSAV